MKKVCLIINEKHPWTNWKLYCVVSVVPEIVAMYKTNGRRTIVKIVDLENNTIVKSRASCHPNDVFDSKDGAELAFARAYKKYMEMKMSK